MLPGPGDRLPGDAQGHLIEDVGDEDPSADKGGLAVADYRVGDNVASEGDHCSFLLA